MISLSVIAMVANASYTTIAPILPLEISKYGINERYISIIFLSFSFGSSIIPPLVAHTFQSIGTVKVMIYSMIGMSIVFWFIGHVFEMTRWISSDTSDDGDSSAVQSSSNKKLIIVSMLTMLQFFLGAFFSVVTTGYYSLSTLLFTDTKESNIMSYIEASVGTGYIIGPIIGSYIYDTMGYQFTFSTFISLSMMLLAFITWRFLSPCLRYKESEEIHDVDSGCFVESDDVEAQIVSDPSSSLSLRHTASYSSIDTSSEKKDSNNLLHSINIEEEEKQTQQQPPPTISSLLRVQKIILAASAISMVNLSWTSIEPLLATRLDNTFHIGKQIGLIFSLSNIIYVPTVFLVQYLPKHVRTLSISIMLTPIAVLLVGSNSLSMVVIGVILLGLLPTPCWIQLLPWMQEQTTMLYPDPKVQPKANDITASIYNSAITSGQVIGYVLGPILGSKGFTRMTHIVALLITCQGIIFILGTEKYCYKSSLRFDRRRGLPIRQTII